MSFPMSPSSVQGLYHCIREVAIARTQRCWTYGNRCILMAHPQTRGDTVGVQHAWPPQSGTPRSVRVYAKPVGHCSFESSRIALRKGSVLSVGLANCTITGS
ncbi:hypothetical protein MRX96_059173 [Rhipicephalus microplus]